MNFKPNANTHVPKKKEEKLPGYLRWRHLVSSVGHAHLPSSVSFLLRVIVLTDSVVSFNTAKGLTNTLSSVMRTVSHLAKHTVTDKHYRQILQVCGEIYTYRKSCTKKELLPVIGMAEIENRAMYCEKKALTWVRAQYTEKHKLAAQKISTQELDALISTDKEFQESALCTASTALPRLLEEEDPLLSSIETSDTNLSGSSPGSSSLFTRAHPASPPSSAQAPSSRGLSILERIREREEERKKIFISLEKEKEKEIETALRTILFLGKTENRKAFEKQFLQKRIPVFSKGLITLDDVLSHPEHRKCLSVKEVNGVPYILIDNTKAHQTQEASKDFCTK
ncbi:hypothetical protein NECID01_1192 [Nematocida sp. AWRm77]|nr:hypothetical protein NECID01_1192 [Nematocida sp. AWRm77]